MSTSVFDQTWQRERDRLRAFEDLFDPASRMAMGQPTSRCDSTTSKPTAVKDVCRLTVREKMGTSGFYPAY